MSKKVKKGCCNCKYSFWDKRSDGAFCGYKAGVSEKIVADYWISNKCKHWEYDGYSDGFDAKEEYENLPNDC